ncbi:MAG: nuclear transport factor 2 family protein [Gemmatimonadaceae bacterium]
MNRILVATVALVTACTAKQQEPASTSHRAVLDAYINAWNRHDSLAVDTLLAKGGVHEDVPFSIRAMAPDGVHAFMRDLLQSSPDYVWKVTDVVEGDNSLAAEWTWTSTYTGDSPNGPVRALKISGRGASIVELENGKIKRFSNYYDEASWFPRKK